MPQCRMQMTLPNEILIEEVAALLAEGRDVELQAKGDSMLPFIVGGRDSVILRREDCGMLRPGDIVLARRSPGDYVLHRIVGVDGDKVQLRGDGNVRGTEFVGQENILGRVTAIVHPSGKACVPGRARFWRNTGPIVRRCILALYRRTIYRTTSR